MLVEAVSDKVYGFKACRKCGHVKHCTDFYLQKGGNSLAPYCKSCHSKTSTENGRRRYKESEVARKKKGKNCADWQKRHPDTYAPILRKALLKRNYGITPQDYDDMVLAQGDKCALCLSSYIGKGKNRAGKPHKMWFIDHCHSTGVVRGLLCLQCNTRLGAYEKLRDEIGFEKVETYLRRKKQ